jgi:membrane protein DedA with SNARE-associated domain
MRGEAGVSLPAGYTYTDLQHEDSVEQFIETNLAAYGPYAVFFLLMLSGIGIALGEEMVTIPAGVLIAAGRLEFVEILIAAWSGIMMADLMWFFICRRYGTQLLHMRWFKRMLHPRRMLETKHQFDEKGVWLIVMARFIPSSRTTAITVTGMFHMPVWKFALANCGCVVFTVPLQLGLGYLVGIGMDEERGILDLILRIVGVVVLVALVSFLIGWWMRNRRSGKQLPRARASWLRRFRRNKMRNGI